MKKTDRLKENLSEDAFFQTVFQASPDAAVLTRVCDGEIIHVNESFCRITGYTQDEVIGKTTIALKLYGNPPDRDAFLSHMAKNGILEPHPFQFRRKDGVYREGLVSARSFHSQGYEYVLYCLGLLYVLRNAEIRRWAKREDAVEYNAQKNQPYRESAAFSECLCELDHGDDHKHDVRNRDQEEQELPAVTPGDLKEHIDIIERDDRCPAGFSSFLEEFPHCDDAENGDREVHNRHKRTCFIRVPEIRIIHLKYPLR